MFFVSLIYYLGKYICIFYTFHGLSKLVWNQGMPVSASMFTFLQTLSFIILTYKFKYTPYFLGTTYTKGQDCLRPYIPTSCWFCSRENSNTIFFSRVIAKVFRLMRTELLQLISLSWNKCESQASRRLKLVSTRLHIILTFITG